MAMSDQEATEKNPPRELEAMAARVADGERPIVTFEALLGWFGLPAPTVRGFWKIENQLSLVGLVTVPSVRECKGLRTLLTFHPDASFVRPLEAPLGRAPTTGFSSLPVSPSLPASPSVAASPPVPSPAISSRRGREPTLRLEHLLHGRASLVSISPEQTVTKAATLLSMHGLTHLAVLRGERTAEGIIGWKSIGEARLRGEASRTREVLVKDAAVKVQIFQASDAVLDVWPHAERDRAVLVQAHDRRIVALLSLEEMAAWMFRVTSPFLLLEELEQHLRNLVDRRLPHALPSGKQTAAALTLGDYVRLLQQPERWDSLKLAIDRGVFVSWLDAAREARNRAMHFAPDGLSASDVDTLQKLVVFLRTMGLGLAVERR